MKRFLTHLLAIFLLSCIAAICLLALPLFAAALLAGAVCEVAVVGWHFGWNFLEYAAAGMESLAGKLEARKAMKRAAETARGQP